MAPVCLMVDSATFCYFSSNMFILDMRLVIGILCVVISVFGNLFIAGRLY